MNLNSFRVVFVLLLASISCLYAQIDSGEAYLTWSAEQAQKVALSTYGDGKVGSRVLLFWTGIDTRWLKTERAQNYKLRATWFTPDVVRGAARVFQLQSRLTQQETRTMVAEAEAAAQTVIMVELDPNEGSGVIPPDWEAFLVPAGSNSPDAAIRGVENPELRKIRVLQGVRQRNYDYDRFWMTFPLVSASGEPLIPADVHEVQLVVRVYSREGVVRWTIPTSIRDRILELSKKAKMSQAE